MNFELGAAHGYRSAKVALEDPTGFTKGEMEQLFQNTTDLGELLEGLNKK